VADNPHDRYFGMSDEERARVEKRIRDLEAIKLYRSEAGSLGHGSRRKSEELERGGGLPREEATDLARHNIMRITTGADPNWQGPVNINSGEPQLAKTPEQIDADNERMFANGGSERGKLWTEGRLEQQRRDTQFDRLVKPTPVPPAPVEEQATSAPMGEALAKAKAFLQKERPMSGVPVSELDDSKNAALRRSARGTKGGT
jgi:hypothetical protein